ncbi:MAG: single-stranded DNA-binding protein [Bacilli bacterium]|nr:single-stranded DNA-binding protein [Bacilli bacterium]
MVNTVMLVGRLVKNPEVVEKENGLKMSKVTIAVNRRFKGPDGVYHADFIDCILWNNYAINVNEYCSKGDLIGIRGRLQVEYVENEGKKKKFTDVIAESITFISSQKNKDIKELKLNEAT